jgi:hypothetical protein
LSEFTAHLLKPKPPVITGGAAEAEGTPMNTFDQVARNACKLDGNALFRWILSRRPDWGYTFDSWTDTRRLTLPGEPDRTNDIVALLKALVLSQQALEDWDMLESQIVLGWMKRGEDRGEVRKAAAFLLECIRTRLTDPVPEDLALAIEGTNDDQTLEQWFNIALQAQDISELRKAMKTS